MYLNIDLNASVFAFVCEYEFEFVYVDVLYSNLCVFVSMCIHIC